MVVEEQTGEHQMEATCLNMLNCLADTHTHDEDQPWRETLHSSSLVLLVLVLLLALTGLLPCFHNTVTVYTQKGKMKRKHQQEKAAVQALHRALKTGAGQGP